jgi:hypothetical protein
VLRLLSAPGAIATKMGVRAKFRLMKRVLARQSRRHVDAVFLIIGQDFKRGAVSRLKHLGRVRKPVCQVQRAAGNLAVETVFGTPGRIMIFQPYKRLSWRADIVPVILASLFLDANSQKK